MIFGIWNKWKKKEFESLRQEMVRVIGDEYGLRDDRVLRVMRKVPRHKFVSEKYRNISYEDCPIPIGHGQTMSQPFTVAKMSSLILANSKLRTQNSKPHLKNQKLKKVLEIGSPLRQDFEGREDIEKISDIMTKTHIQSSTKVLEIGTGSGYQAAILSYLFDEVYTVEVVPGLANLSKTVFERLGYKNVKVKVGNGKDGWEEKSLFDAIVITAGVEEVPKKLFEQLIEGGVMVVPIGKGYDKTMTRFIKQSEFKSKYMKEEFGIFHFVPFVE